MPLDAPPRSPEQEELDAIIEEARRRARRRRRGYALLIGLVALLGVGAYLGFDQFHGGGTSTSGGATSGGGASAVSHSLFLDGPNKYGRLTQVDTRTGRSHLVRVSAGCGDADVCLDATGGKLVIGSVGRTDVYDPGAAKRSRTKRLGRGWIIVPSAVEGRVWLGILDRRPNAPPGRPLRALREQTVGGRVIRSVRPPGEDGPVAAIKAGFLFAPSRLKGGRLKVWNPRTRTVTGHVSGAILVASAGNLVASCGGSCGRIYISDGGHGQTTTVKPPPGNSFGVSDAAFSPDGSLLAVPVEANAARGESQWSMALVNFRRGTSQLVTGARLDPVYQPLAWSPAGRLFFSASGGRIMSYEPGTPKATLLTRVDGTVFHMAAP